MTSLTLNTHDIHTNPTSRLALMSHQQAATFHFTGPNMLIIHQQTPEQKKKTTNETTLADPGSSINHQPIPKSSSPSTVPLPCPHQHRITITDMSTIQLPNEPETQHTLARPTPREKEDLPEEKFTRQQVVRAIRYGAHLRTTTLLTSGEPAAIPIHATATTDPIEEAS